MCAIIVLLDGSILVLHQVTYVIPEDNLVDSGLYYRTLPSNTYIVNAMISLLDHFQWYRIGLVNSGSAQYLEVCMQQDALRFMELSSILRSLTFMCSNF